MKVTAIISWVLVIAITVGIALLNQFSGNIDRLKKESMETGPDWQFEFMGKYTLGASRALKQSGAKIMDQMADHAVTNEQEIATAIVSGEVEGKDAAIQRLKRIGDSEADNIVAYYNEKADTIDADSFAEHYPWHYRLAKVFGREDDSFKREQILRQADWTFRGVFIGMFGLLFIAAIGLVLLLLAIILLATGKLKFKTPDVQSHGHIYIESFAIYLFLFVAISIVVALLPESIPLGVKMIPMGLVVVFAACWPLMREVKWADYRKTVGLHKGRGFFVEIFWGVVGYIACLPLVGIGFVVTYILMNFSHQQSTHPIAFEMNKMSPLLLYGLAAVFAPLTEELMFRGIFVSHLRSWGTVLSSAIVSGLIFATIHPQGWVAIPVLGIMGMNFALIRQWRDSLIPSITAHALNNGALVTLLMFIAR